MSRLSDIQRNQLRSALGNIPGVDFAEQQEVLSFYNRADVRNALRGSVTGDARINNRRVTDITSAQLNSLVSATGSGQLLNQTFRDSSGRLQRLNNDEIDVGQLLYGPRDVNPVSGGFTPRNQATLENLGYSPDATQFILSLTGNRPSDTRYIRNLGFARVQIIWLEIDQLTNLPARQGIPMRFLRPTDYAVDVIQEVFPDVGGPVTPPLTPPGPPPSPPDSPPLTPDGPGFDEDEISGPGGGVDIFTFERAARDITTNETGRFDAWLANAGFTRDEILERWLRFDEFGWDIMFWDDLDYIVRLFQIRGVVVTWAATNFDGDQAILRDRTSPLIVHITDPISRNDLLERAEVSDPTVSVADLEILGAQVVILPLVEGELGALLGSAVGMGNFEEYEDSEIYCPKSSRNDCLEACIRKCIGEIPVELERQIDSLLINVSPESREILVVNRAISSFSPPVMVRKLGNPIGGAGYFDIVLIPLGRSLEFHAVVNKGRLSELTLSAKLDRLVGEDQPVSLTDLVKTTSPLKLTFTKGRGNASCFFDIECWQKDKETNCYAVGYTTPMIQPDFNRLSSLVYDNVNTGQILCPCKPQSNVFNCFKCGFGCRVGSVSRSLLVNYITDVPDDRCDHEWVCYFCGRNRKDGCVRKGEDYIIPEEKVCELVEDKLAEFNMYRYTIGEGAMGKFLNNLFDSIVIKIECDPLFYRNVDLSVKGNRVYFEVDLYAFNGGRYDFHYVLRDIPSQFRLMYKLTGGSDPMYSDVQNYMVLRLARDIDHMEDSIVEGICEAFTTYRLGMSQSRMGRLVKELEGFGVIFKFRDAIRYTTPQGLSSFVKGQHVPSKFWKGEFQHKKITCWDDVETHKSEVLPYLYNDVMGLTLGFGVHSLSLRRNLKPSKGQLQVTNYLTLSSMSYNFVHSKIKNALKGFDNVCLTYSPTVGLTRCLKSIVKEASFGGKVEVFKHHVPLPSDCPFSEEELIIGMDPKGSMACMLPQALDVEESFLTKIVEEVLCTDCVAGACSHAMPRNCGHAFEHYVISHPHFSEIEWHLGIFHLLSEYYPEVDLSKMVTLIGLIKDLQVRVAEYEVNLASRQNSPEDVLECDLNSLYPSMFKFPIPVGMSKDVLNLKQRMALHPDTLSSLEDSLPHKKRVVDIYESHDSDEIRELFELSKFDNSSNLEGGMSVVGFSYYSFIECSLSYVGNEDVFTNCIPLRLNGQIFWTLLPRESCWYSCYDLEIALSSGWAIDKTSRGIFIRASFAYKPVVENLYEIRRELKSRGNPDEKVYKLILNSFYGGLNKKNRRIFRFGTKEELEELEGVRLPTIRSVSADGRYYKCVMADEKEFKCPNHSGSAVTSLARYYMHSIALQSGFLAPIASNPIEVFYCDTDSYHVNRPGYDSMKNLGLEHKNLGGFKVDTQLILCSYYVVRKTYAQICFDGEKLYFKIKNKGVSSPLAKNCAMRVFQNFKKHVIGMQRGATTANDAGLMTTTTTRKNGGVVFQEQIKRMRHGCQKTGFRDNDKNTRTPFR